MPALRRLPFVPQVAPDESLISWVDRTAAFYEQPRVRTLVTLGLADDHRYRPAPVGVTLHADLRRNLRQSGGLTDRAIDGMLLDRYAGTLYPVRAYDDTRGLARSMRKAWLWPTFSRACPRCVDDTDGVWLTSWKTGWNFLCPHHDRFLIAVCSACGSDLQARARDRRQQRVCCAPKPPVGPDGTHPTGGPVPSPRNPEICGMPVADMPADPVADPRLIALQQRITDRLQAGPSEETLRWFSSMSWCYRLAMFLAPVSMLQNASPPVREAFARHSQEQEQREREGRVAVNDLLGSEAERQDPRLTAAGCSIAVELVDGEDTEDAWVTFIAQARGGPTAEVLQRARSFDHRLPDDVKRPFQRARVRNSVRIPKHQKVGGPTRVGPGAAPGYPSWRHVPQLLWPRAHAHMAVGPLQGGRIEARRSSTAVMLVRWLTTELSSYAKAAALIDVPYSSFNKTLATEMNRSGLADVYAQRLDDLTRWLQCADTRIDYADRRAAFADLRSLTDSEWERLRADMPATRRSGPYTRGGCAAWLWVILTGGNWRAAPAYRADGGPAHYSRMQRRTFVRSQLPLMLPTLRAFAAVALEKSGLPGPIDYDYTPPEQPPSAD